jgi:hypothetical protein
MSATTLSAGRTDTSARCMVLLKKQAGECIHLITANAAYIDR